MANFDVAIPYEIMKEFDDLYRESPEMYSEVLKAGGQTAYDLVVGNAPPSLRSSNIMHNLKMTKVYRTPSDEAINIKVGFYGYFVNHLGKSTPAPLVANLFEYGSSNIQKQPFFRKSMRSRLIISQMMSKELELLKQIIKSNN